MRFTDTKFETYKIADLSNVITGGTPSTKNSNYWNGDIRWMPSGDIHKKYIFDVSKRITKEGLNNSSTKLIPPKSILVALAGQGKTRGTSAISEIETCINQSIAAILPSQRFNSYYLFHLLESKYEDLRLISSGDGGRGGLNKELILNYKCSIPSYEEQYKVAIFLNTIDQRIDTQIKIIEETETYINRIKEKILNNFSSNLNLSLNELCQITTGKLDANAMVTDGEYRFYTCAEKYYYIDKYAFDTEALLISGNGANVGYIHYYKGKFNAYQRTYVLTDFNANPLIIKLNLDVNLKRRINEQKNTGNTPYIKIDTIANMKIKLFDKDDELTVLRLIESLERKKENNNRLLELLSNQKDFLLKNMFV